MNAAMFHKPKHARPFDAPRPPRLATDPRWWEYQPRHLRVA